MARNNQNTVPEPMFSSDDEMRESECFKDSSLVELVSILPGRLQLAIMTKKPKCEENDSFYLFSTDEQLVYANFYQDFGPLNLAKLCRYCICLNNALQEETRASKTVIHYTRKDPKKILNAAYLIASYSIIYLRFNVQTAMKALDPILKHANGAKYCDASINDLAYLPLKDCLSAVQKAMQRNFFNFKDFDANDYEYYECVENGDLNWIIPDKLLAFCGPNFRTERTSDSVMLGPEVYVDYFHAHNVTVVVRLNSPMYDSKAFTKAGIQHYDLYFSDGSTPSDRLVKQFLKICENSRGAVAVHCKAGLGRTGTLIGAFMVKHYQFSAMESIGWLRICRPGSVIGQQQTWLNSKQSQLLQEGELYRQLRQHHTYNPPDKHARGIYSLQVGTEDDTQCAKNATVEQTTGQAIESENVQRISQRVDTMCLNDEDEQEHDCLDVASQVNNNVVHCKPNRIKKVTKLTSRYIRGNRLTGGRTIVTTTTTTSTIRRGRGNATVPPLGGTQQRPSQETYVTRRKTVASRQTATAGRTEATSAPSVRNQRNASVQTATQGDQLNSIKAARRHHVPRDSIQQKTRSDKVILPPPSTISSSPDRHITPASNVADKDKGDTTVQNRTDTVKNNKTAEGGTSQPIQPTIRKATIFLAPSPISCIANQPDRSIAPASQSTDKCVPVTHGSVTRTMKKNHPAEGPNSQPTSLPTRKSIEFITKVTTAVNQGKEFTYEASLELNRVLRNFVGTCSMWHPSKLLRKGKTFETLLRFDRHNYLLDMFTFDVSINVADILTGDKINSNINTNHHTRTKSLQSAIKAADANHSTKGTLTFKRVSNKAPSQQQRIAFKQVEKVIPAKVTWWLEECKKFTFRVSFDLAVLHNICTVPALVFDANRKSTTLPATSEPVKQQFDTIVTGTREDETGSYVNFSLEINLRHVLDKPKMQGSKSVAQPCSSKIVKPQCTSLAIECIDTYTMVLLDHNGNDASPAPQHEKQQPIPPRTANTNAETDTRPYKRLRVDVSRL